MSVKVGDRVVNVKTLKGGVVKEVQTVWPRKVQLALVVWDATAKESWVAPENIRKPFGVEAGVGK